MKLSRILFLLLPLAVPAIAQTSASTNFSTGIPKESAKCSIQGQVVQEPGGQPIKKANIEVRPWEQDDGATYKAVTDAEGRFKVEDIEPGAYGVYLERNGFLEAEKRRRRHFGGHMLTLVPGQEIKDLVFRMQPAAVISGKILDADGDPVPQVNITVTHYRTASGWRGIAGNGFTNDLGEYRVSNLLPGRYVIKAFAMRSMDGPEAEQTAEKTGGAKEMVPYPTYYPGTAERSQAAPLELHAGDEVPVNLTLVSGPAFHVRGTVSGLPGPAGSESLVTLRPKEGDPWQMQAAGTKVKKDGSFEIPKVLPGSYRVMFVTISASDQEMVEASQTIEVKDTDVDAVRLTPEVPARIIGQVRAENNQKLDWTRVSIRLESSEDDSEFGHIQWVGGPVTMAQVKSDGSFEMNKVAPGSYHLMIFGNGFQDYFLKTANLGGRDVADSGFTIGGGTLAFDVVLSTDSATLEGSVVDSKDQPVSDAMVVAIPNADRRKRRDLFGQATTDQRGHFTLRGLRPGEFTAFAWEDTEEDYHDPDVLKQFEDSGEKVRVEGGERKSVLLKVIPGTDEQ
jgi:protocatechuate 3,4-dioxygenase beta subunit